MPCLCSMAARSHHCGSPAEAAWQPNEWCWAEESSHPCAVGGVTAANCRALSGLLPSTVQTE